MIAGRYSLEREIGRGGTGAVWLGRDDLLGRPVVLKRIGRLPGDDRTDVVRAEREARLSARLHHPHVVAVFDVVEDEESDDHWLVMEHVDGPTLAQLVRRKGRLGPDEAAPLLAQAADGLCAAHAAGITHRDVKPSNILVGHDGQVKLTDFGIARITTDAPLTRTGLVTGSPQYLAPEVASGGRGGLPADVWSLGATAYHVLAGRPPYDAGEHVLATLCRIVDEEPPRLADAGPLAPLLEGTLVKDPARRWTMAQARDFLAAPARTATVAQPEEPDAEHTRVLDTRPAPPARPAADLPAAPAVTAAPLPTAAPWRRGRSAVAATIAAAALLAFVVGYAVLTRHGSGGAPAAGAAGGSASSSAPPSPAVPTARGMEAFIRNYVTTVADDPELAWTMLTPKFQRESGGLEHYVDFWESARNGKVLGISADPATLSVSYQVHFDDWDNGPGPTVLDLAFHDGRYRIDGERSAGFVPAD